MVFKCVAQKQNISALRYNIYVNKDFRFSEQNQLMLYSVKNKKSNRLVIRVVLFLSGVLVCLFAAFTNLLISIFGIYLLVMVLFIRDRELAVYKDRIELKNISPISIFSSKEIFYYRDITKINYDKSFTNIKDELFNVAAWNPSTNSKPDTIEILKSDGTWRVINRIGNKQEFENAFICMLSQMQNIQKSR